jgi:release factor glutamine methyltransferase
MISLPDTIQDILNSTSKFNAGFSESSYLDNQVLLAHVLQKNRAWLLAYPEYKLTSIQKTHFANLYSQYVNGKPLPYLIGTWEFYGLSFVVDEHVLIPRPETELLVEEAISFISSSTEHKTICEVGIGSGCISISIAKTAKNVSIQATDISPEALKVSKTNINAHQLEKTISISKNDLLDNITGPFDLIIGNLPYIPSAEVIKLAVFEKEPTLALDGGEDGFEIIARLLQQATQKLSPRGLILLELDASHREIALKTAKEFFPTAKIKVQADLTGRDRLLHIQT